MDKKQRKLALEAVEHGAEATRLLKISKQVHQAEKKGLIAEKDAIDLAVDLNERAIAEMEKTIELQKAFIAAQDNK